MKKNIFLLAYAVSVLFIGCTHKEDMEPNGVETNGTHVVATAGIVNPASKVALGDGTEKISVTWTEGEIFSVLQGTASIAPAPFTQNGDISADGKSASFEGDLTGTAEDCYAFSPALSAETAAATAVALDMTGQDGSLKGAHTYMWAKGTYAEGEPLNFDFKQLTAILKVNMTFPSDVTGPATGVTFVADEGLVVKATADITGENPAVAATVSGNIALTGEVAVDENVAVAYFNVLPSTIKNLRVVATVGGQQYIGLISSSCAPAASKAYSLDVTMAALDNYYVSTTGTGMGESFANAMSLDTFLALVKINEDAAVTAANAAMLDGKKFCFAEGTYEIPCFKIEYSGYSKQVAYTLEGGYTSATEHEGVTTINPVDETGVQIFNLGNQVELSCKGIVFDGNYDTVAKKVRAFTLGCGAESYATLRLNDCILKNFNISGNGTGAAAQGGAIRLTVNAAAYLDNVELSNNVAENRGGAIALGDKSAKLFMNCCRLYENKITTDDSASWGASVNGQSSSLICMNNTTIFGAKGTSSSNCAVVNADSWMLLVNTTVISNESNQNGTFRAGNRDRKAVLINNLISKGEGEKCFGTTNVTSKGYNAYQVAADSEWTPESTDTDYSEITLPAATLTNGAYVWTVDASQTSFATKAEVVAAVKAFGKDNGLFLEWLGEDAFGVDGRGNARNASKMQPGAYDAGL